jgi:hypothetical protein
MTGILELIALQNVVNGSLLAAMWRSAKKAERHDLLMGRARQPKRTYITFSQLSWLVGSYLRRLKGIPTMRACTLLLLVLSDLPAVDAVTAVWPMSQRGVGQTSLSPSVGPTSLSAGPAWSFDLGGPVGSAPVISAEGIVYVVTSLSTFTSGPPTLYAFKPNGGFYVPPVQVPSVPSTVVLAGC